MRIDWQNILSEHGPVVWKAVRCLVGNEADARDVYQETFLQAFQFSQTSDIEDWLRLLRRIARMRAMDLLRKRYRIAAHSDSDASSEEVACAQPLPEDHFAAGELSDRLRIALTRLTEQQAEVFVMRYVEELPYDEIAQRTKSNRNAVGVMLNRARAQLQRLLDPSGDSQRETRSTSQETSS